MKRFERFVEFFLVALMTTLVLNVLWQVASRYLLNDPSSFTDELARYLLIWTGFLGAAYGTGKHIHLAIDLIPSRLTSAYAKLWHGLLVNSLVALFAVGVMIIGGARLVYVTWVLEQRSSALGIPLGLVYLIIPISGVIILLYMLRDMIILVSAYKLKSS
jgi:TRAP-type C4-dicarboxylate transport system permease small subunit